MNFEFLKHFWWVVATSDEVTSSRPHAVRLLGKDFVLFRAERGSLACFEDRCPHRQIPLSLGRVVDCRLKCAYHGWEFDEAGNCTEVPGRIGESFSAPLLKAFQVYEAHGLIWLCSSDEPQEPKPFVTPHLHSAELETRVECFEIATNMIDILENFMDPFHTAILHDGLIRRDSSRSVNKIMPAHTDDGFEVRYEKEQPQSNWFQLFQRKIESDLGRFRMPGIIELEFHSEEHLEFANAFYITPIDEDNVRMTTVVSVKQRLLPAWLLFLFAKPILLKALKQDIWMLELQNKARHNFPDRKQIILDTDIVRKQLELSLSGSDERVKFKSMKAML